MSWSYRNCVRRKLSIHKFSLFLQNTQSYANNPSGGASYIIWLYWKLSISLLPDRLSSLEVLKKLSFPNFLLNFISNLLFLSLIYWLDFNNTTTNQATTISLAVKFPASKNTNVFSFFLIKVASAWFSSSSSVNVSSAERLKWLCQF